MKHLYYKLLLPVFLIPGLAFAQPANDDCANAIEVFLGAGQSFDNTDATLDGPDHPSAPCFSFGDDNVSNDIWYVFNSDFDGAVEFSTCGMAGFDTRMAVYQNGSTCPVADEDLLACNDDGGGCANFTSYMLFNVETGGSYLLRLGGYAAGDVGSGTFDLLEIVPPPVPANDLCENATPVDIVSEAAANGGVGWFSGTTIGAFFSAEIPTCSINELGEFQDVWYSFNAGAENFIEMRIESSTPTAEFCIDIYEACEVLAASVDDGGDLESNCFSAAEIDIANNGVIEAGSFEDDTEYLIRVSSQITYFPPGDFEMVLIGTSGTGVEEPHAEAFRIYPNPSNGMVQIQNATTSGQKILRVLDSTGRVVLDTQYYLNQGQTLNLDLQDLGSGLYFVQLSEFNGQMLGTGRLILE